MPQSHSAPDEGAGRLDGGFDDIDRELCASDREMSFSFDPGSDGDVFRAAIELSRRQPFNRAR